MVWGVTVVWGDRDLVRVVLWHAAAPCCVGMWRFWIVGSWRGDRGLEWDWGLGAMHQEGLFNAGGIVQCIRRKGMCCRLAGWCAGRPLKAGAAEHTGRGCPAHFLSSIAGRVVPQLCRGGCLVVPMCVTEGRAQVQAA
eukprot:scaffold253982_cov21-Tisochrysis_lutea.AAC.1